MGPHVGLFNNLSSLVLQALWAGSFWISWLRWFKYLIDEALESCTIVCQEPVPLVGTLLEQSDLEWWMLSHPLGPVGKGMGRVDLMATH